MISATSFYPHTPDAPNNSLDVKRNPFMIKPTLPSFGESQKDPGNKVADYHPSLNDVKSINIPNQNMPRTRKTPNCNSYAVNTENIEKQKEETANAVNNCFTPADKKIKEDNMKKRDKFIKKQRREKQERQNHSIKINEGLNYEDDIETVETSTQQEIFEVLGAEIQRVEKN